MHSCGSSAFRQVFYSLLQYLGNADDIQWVESIKQWLLKGISSINGDWGVFDFLRKFLNTFYISFINFSMFVAGGVMSAVGFISSLIGWLFAF